MTRQFQRRASINLGGRLLEGLDASFEVVRTLAQEQNTARVGVFNLSEDTRKFLHDQNQGVVVEVLAGYSDQTDLARVFLGRCRTVTSTRTLADWMTTLEAGDGDVVRQTRVVASYPTGASLKGIVSDLVNSLKADAGNLVQALKGVPDQRTDGPVTVNEPGDQALGTLLGRLDLEHSWQEDALQVIRRTGAVNTTAVLLSPETGLLGNPEVAGRRVVSGQVQRPAARVVSLLNPDVFPGRIVRVEAESWTGSLVARRVVHTGETWGGEWSTSVEGLVI